MKNYSVLDKLVPQTERLHRAIFDEGYTQGCMDGKAEAYKNPKSLDAYQLGLEDAWTASLTIMDMDENDIAEVFGIDYTYANILRNYTALEAIENIKEWAERKEKSEITVGDEVNAPGFHAPVVVIALYDDSVKVMSSCGDTGVHPKCNLVKTGRHFSEIPDLFKVMQEGKE